MKMKQERKPRGVEIGPEVVSAGKAGKNCNGERDSHPGKKQALASSASRANALAFLNRGPEC
jgi:hypothetical protein